LRKNKIINRELSWLSFNERVLQEAESPNVPLLERLRFVGIFSSNRDEFFRVRVATLRRMVTFQKQSDEQFDFNASMVLDQVEEKIKKLQKRFDKAYFNILEDLEKEQIFIVNENQINEQQGIFVKKYFREKVRLEIFPISVNPEKDFPLLQDASIYLAIRFLDKKDKEFKYWLIEVPSSLPRFLVLPTDGSKTEIMFLDDVIRFNFDEIFQIYDHKNLESYTIKFTRDAELDIDNDVSQSFLMAVELSLEKRKAAEPLRFIYDADMPKDFLNFIVEQMDISKRGHLYAGLRYHNFKDFMKFPTVGKPNLWYNFPPQLPHPDFEKSRGLMNKIKEKDILLYFPYHSFDYFLDLLREAAIDPLVSHIRITIYRLANDSHVIKSLINAVRNGKFVTVVIELRARFDEASNIKWANKLIEEGIRVIPGVNGLKVHTKLCLITRRENGKKIYYSAIGTGNFHEKTARIYTDFLLLTANQILNKEARELFSFFEKNYMAPKPNKLLVAPFNLRFRIVSLINREIRFAKSGVKAEIMMKMNNLVDPEIVMKLYQASQSGVKIKLIIRGICALVANVEEQSENIEVISIVDKFLEHGRVFIFENGGSPDVYLGSSDMMARNLDFRVELLAPLLDQNISNQVLDIMNMQWNDNQKARIISEDQSNKFREPKDDTIIRSQDDIYDYYEKFAQQQKNEI
jgi:polyphosphate kinase